MEYMASPSRANMRSYRRHGVGTEMHVQNRDSIASGMKLLVGSSRALLIGLAGAALLIGALPALASADAVPSVVFLSPQAGAAFTGADTITLQVSATDSSGVRVVQIYDGERLLCVDSTAPYACTFTPTASDIGNVTFVAAAINTAGAQALAVRTVQISPSKPLGVSLYTHVAAGGRAASKLATGGTLRLPPADVPSFCGQGAVQIEYIYGHTHFFYLAYVDRQCRFVAPAVRIPRAVKTVLVQARFLGSRSLIGSALLGHLVSLRANSGRGRDSKHRPAKAKPH
jgi:Bacterial Ig domain